METFPVNVAYRHAEVSARVRRGGVTSVIVKLRTDTGLVGWGEACVRCRCRLDRRRTAGDAAVRARPQTRGTARPSPATSTAPGLWDYRVQTGNFAFAGIDMALWDLCGKDCGQPLHRLFGGPVRDELDYFYYLAQGTPDELRAQCADGVERGYRWFYLKVGLDAEAEEAMLEAVRAAIGPSCHIRIDANEAWSVPEAARLLERWHARFGLDFAEAPVPIFPLDRMRDLRSPHRRRLVRQRGPGQRRRGLSGDRQRRGRCRLLQQLLGRHAAPLPHAGVARRPPGHRRLQAHPWRARHRRRRGAPAHADAARTPCRVRSRRPRSWPTTSWPTPLPIATGPRWGVPDAPGLGVEVDEDQARTASPPTTAVTASSCPTPPEESPHAHAREDPPAQRQPPRSSGR